MKTNENDYKIFFCPNCSSVYSGVESTENCPKCNIELFETQTYRSVWRTFSDEKKNQMKILYSNMVEKETYEKKQKEKNISNILISSGFNFDGYKIVKYSGYISGDDVVQIPRSGIFGSNNGKKLTDALVKIRSRALDELREAAYALDCNAVIGVDFDYITLEPETANLRGGTLYEPYIICVTANGNAVVIEKEDV